MGFRPSKLLPFIKTNTVDGNEDVSDNKFGNNCPTENPEHIDTNRIKSLVSALRDLSRLQDEALNTQLDTRQKRRRAGLQREKVWQCDDDLMKVIRGLVSQGLAQEFGQLLDMTERCQHARDALGNLEQQLMEVEQGWEEKLEDLREAEDKIISEFGPDHEHYTAYDLMKKTPSRNSCPSNHEVSGETTALNFAEKFGGGVRPLHSAASESSLILRPEEIADLSSQRSKDLEIPSMQGHTDFLAVNSKAPHPISGDGNLDIDDNETISHSKDYGIGWGAASPLPAEFEASRERVSIWMKEKALSSRLESAHLFTILVDELAREDMETPSCWAQLVIANWEFESRAPSIF